MPLVKRKKVVLYPVPEPSTFTEASSSNQVKVEETPATTSDANGTSSSSANGGAPAAEPDVYYLKQTGEIFADYESYARRMTFYKQRVFQCEVSGRSGLDFFAALESERQEARNLHARFPECLKKPVLRAVQFQMIGRLDHLTDAVHDRFNNRFFDGEKLFVDVQGDKYYCRITKTFPPRNLKPTVAPSSPASSMSALSDDGRPGFSSKKSLPVQNGASSEPHSAAGNLNLSQAEADAMDDPNKYIYNVQLIDSGATAQIMGEDFVPSAIQGGVSIPGESGEKWSGSFMEVHCDVLSRDRMSFSKSILRRFLRDCVDRESATASPWIVKKPLAEKYGIPTQITGDVMKGIANVKKDKLDKRKKASGWKEGDEETKGAKKARIAIEKEEELIRQKELQESGIILPAEEKKPETPAPKRKKPVKYPAEDLLVEYSARELKMGKILERPRPSKLLPFGELFEIFLSTWSCLTTLGDPLVLSLFSFDDYESALQTKMNCTLMNEICATLLNAIIEDHPSNFVRPLASYGAVKKLDPLDPDAPEDSSELSVEEEPDETDLWEGKDGIKADNCIRAGIKVGDNWQYKGELSVKDGREGWEARLVGCLIERGTIKTFPHIYDILAHLLFKDADDAPPSWATMAVDPADADETFSAADPSGRFAFMDAVWKLETVAFLCELAVQTKLVRDYMEDCTQQLTEVRKEIQDVRRDRKKWEEDLLAITGPNETEKKEESLSSATPALESASAMSDDGNMSVDHPSTRDIDDEDQLADDGSSSLSGESSTAGGPSSSNFGSPFAGGARGPSSRHEIIRQNQLLKAADEKARSAQRAKDKVSKAQAKKATTHRSQLEDDIRIATKREEELERDFRKLIHAPRVKPMGYDRFGNKVWWFDGVGSAPLLGVGGKVLFGTGRVFLQGVAEMELERLRIKSGVEVEEVTMRRLAEEGSEDVLKPGEWAVYDDPEQMTKFLEWLNIKGTREIKLHDSLKKWWHFLHGGAVTRVNDSLLKNSSENARRATRAQLYEDGTADYMQWINRKALPQ